MKCEYRKCRKQTKNGNRFCCHNHNSLENQELHKDAMKTRFSHLYTDQTWAGLLSQEWLLKPYNRHV